MCRQLYCLICLVLPTMWVFSAHATASLAHGHQMFADGNLEQAFLILIELCKLLRPVLCLSHADKSAPASTVAAPRSHLLIQSSAAHHQQAVRHQSNVLVTSMVSLKHPVTSKQIWCSSQGMPQLPQVAFYSSSKCHYNKHD